MGGFVHLHNHTDFSLLDGASNIKKMIARAKALEMAHLAITDHGNLFGALRFYNECKNNEINPIIGCEFYMAPKSRFLKSGTESGNKYYHFVMLAKNETGYRNLIKLSSLGYTEGFYYKPRIDEEILQQHCEGTIALSACLAGEIPELIMQNRLEDARKKAEYYNRLFPGDDFYLELQDHGIPDQKLVNDELKEIARVSGIPMVATNDCHYINANDAKAQDILLCIGTNRKFDEQNRMRFESQEFYLKSREEMDFLYPDVPEALDLTVEVAKKCNLEIELPGPLLPDYQIPEGFNTPDDYLRHISNKGLGKRYLNVSEDIKKRLDHELNIIISMGFTGYFLIVWDFIRHAKDNDIPVGPGRGSGAGSIAAYALEITDIDPLKYNLLFERFLNPERVSMPDFDIDFCFERRQEVIDYVTQKYGKEKVGQIITFGTLKPKAVLKDVARALDIPFAESNEITKLVPADAKTINKALEMDEKLQEFANRGGVYSDLFEVAQVLEGLSRHASTHAAGIVIGKEELTRYVPLYRDSKTGAISTQFTMDLLEDCGLVKMDFLGLKTLTLIKNTEKLIRKRGIDFDIEKISEEDEKTFRLLGEGKSTCVFQFESQGMQGILKRAKPNSIEDLIALNALYRPGPMANIDQFIDSKFGRQKIQYPHPDLEQVLKETYGVIVYQEQVMQIAQIIAGYSLGGADILRRAMGKKKVEVMEKEKIRFIEGAVKQGYDAKLADEIFEILIPFAGYGFNKSHAAAYSVLAYKTAYLKANYPAEFMAANLTNEINSPDKLADYISESKEMGIQLLPPNINLSEQYFTVVEGKIVYGLMGIKNVGAAAVEEILRTREEEGAFKDFSDFLERVDLKTVNKKVIETSIQCGVYDSLNENRAQLFENLERAVEYAIQKKESSKFGQTSLFDGCKQEEFPDFQYTPIQDWPKSEKLRFENEHLGFYFSGHPLDEYKDQWQAATDLDLSQAERAKPDKNYNFLGLMRSFREIVTKKGRKMAFGTLEDYNGAIEVVFFSDIYEKSGYMLNLDSAIGIVGKIDLSRGDPKVIAEEIRMPESLAGKGPSEVHIKLENTEFSEEILYDLRDLMVQHSGACPVYLHVPNGRNSNSSTTSVVKVSNHITVSSKENSLELIEASPHVQEVWTR